MKDLIEKYWWILAALVIIVLVWIFIKPNPNRELNKKFQQERKAWQNERKQNAKRIETLRLDSIQIRTEMAERSKTEAERKRQDDIRYEKLKRSKAKIDLRGSTNHELDSIAEWLYPDN
jgi:predicted Holliday junction resolvase-like endonuclease